MLSSRGRGGLVGFKDVYRRRDSGDGYRSVEREGSSERRLQPDEMAKREEELQKPLAAILAWRSVEVRVSTIGIVSSPRS